jgi:hypothetical protein
MAIPGGAIRRRRVPVVAALVVAAVLVAACSDSGYHYVKNSDEGVYFKVPNDWKLYDESTYFKAILDEPSPTQLDAVLDRDWAAAFDSDPDPSPKNLNALDSKHPHGFARVSEIGVDEHDTFSLEAARNLVAPVDELIQADAAQILDADEFTLDGGFRGSHIVVNLGLDKGGFTTLDQTVIVDADTTKVYVLVIGCSDDCYDKNKGEIESLVDSWTVKER